MVTERLAPARAQALAHEQAQVRRPVVSREGEVVPRQWFEAARRFAYLAPFVFLLGTQPLGDLD